MESYLDTTIMRPPRKDEPGRGPHLAPIRLVPALARGGPTLAERPSGLRCTPPGDRWILGT